MPLTYMTCTWFFQAFCNTCQSHTSITFKRNFYFGYVVIVFGKSIDPYTNLLGFPGKTIDSVSGHMDHSILTNLFSSDWVFHIVCIILVVINFHMAHVFTSLFNNIIHWCWFTGCELQLWCCDYHPVPLLLACHNCHLVSLNAIIVNYIVSAFLPFNITKTGVMHKIPDSLHIITFYNRASFLSCRNHYYTLHIAPF